MKLKMDFVTNSSSSSFIVVFPNKIMHVDDVLKFIADKQQATTVFNDAMELKPWIKNDELTLSKVAKEITHGSVDGCNSSWGNDSGFCLDNNIKRDDLRNNIEWNRLMWDEHELKDNVSAVNVAKKFMKGLPNESYIYVFEYGDNSGEYFARLEHDDIFHELKHIRVSKH